MFNHDGLKNVVVDDANGVLLHGQSDCEALSEGDDATYNVWVFNDRASGFGDTVGEIQLHKLKKNDKGHYVA